jgi:probable addiction module antidote protein
VIEIRHYVSRVGKDVFDDWLTQLADARAQAKIATRINRLAAGNFGDCKSLRQGLYELRIDLGTRLSRLLRDDRQGMCIASRWRRQTKAGRGHRAGIGIFERLQRKERNLVKRKASVSHDKAVIRRLRKDSDFAAEYLKAALEDEDEPRVLLIALRHLAQAQGIAKVAKAAGIERESLYRALSEHGNPRLSTLVAVTKAIGLRLTVEAAQ